MKKAYEEIMDQIEVTEEMKLRILNRIQTETVAAPPAKVTQFQKYRKFVPLAACFVLLVAGMWGATRISGPVSEPPLPSGVQVVPDIVEAASAEELAGLVGFEVADVKSLPFEPSEILYTAYWGELAEIQYHSDHEEAVFRKSAGDEDNSWDSNLYDTTSELTVGDITVILKGNSGRYTLAIWSANGFSYSLSISSGAAVEEWTAMIAETV